MRKTFINESRFKILCCLAVLGFLAALIILPNQFRSNAGKQTKNIEKSEIYQERLENYDIRTDKRAFEKIAQFRGAQGKAAAEIADTREEFVRGEEELKTRVPTLKVEYNADLRIPEVIAPDVKRGRAFLTESSDLKRSEILRRFAKENNNLLGTTDHQLDTLKVSADYSNPDGKLSFTRLEQFIGDVPVFQGEIKAGFTKDGRVIRVINNLAPKLDYQSLSTDFRNPLEAVKAAARFINDELDESELTINEADSDGKKIVFGKGDWATTAEKIYFPTEPGVAVPAWRVLIWQPVNAYYVIVDAENGTLLWRKNITEDQTQPATYNIYANPNAMINVADSPAPMTPGPISPSAGTQGALINRTSVTLIGNEAPYTFNNNGWITDGNNITDGNAVEAGLDRVAPDGVDAPVQGSGFRDFTFNYNPAPGNPAPGDSVLGTEPQKGGVIQLFYIINRYHDELYRLGFTEQAGNFQHDNFGRGGFGNDRVAASSQDNFCPNSTGCANNANFGTVADGGRGRMQMFLFTNTIPNRDGSLDADIVIHEMTHGLSNRLHGNAFGLSTNMARGMGEGWSDFYSLALLSEPSDPIDGVYASGGYATHLLRNAGFTGNYYYGVRRFPKAVMASTGGPNNRPHNPLTFADIDSTQANNNDGAFAPAFVPGADGTHAMGEVWSTALWEVRAKLITRLGWEVGNRRMLQYVTDGMKLSPSTPTFLQSRDAIIAAAQASLPASQVNPDVVDIWEGFRIRGMGYSASVTNAGSGGNTTRVVEAFDSPNVAQTPIYTFSDAAGDGDGFAEPGETVTLTIPLFNNTGLNADNTILQIVGGGSANYETISNNTTASRTVNYTVPSGTACGGSLTLTFQITNSLGTLTVTRPLLIGTPNITFSENFDGLSAPAIPDNWAVTSLNGGIAFVTSSNNSDTAPNSAFALDPLTVGGGTNLTSPSIPITAANATVSFRNRYDTEDGWDGGVLEISVGGGAFQDILAAGGSFIQNGYNSSLGPNPPNDARNPLANRAAWTGNSGGFVTTIAQLPASAAGQNVQLRWRFGADDNTAELGWNIDTIKVSGNSTCSVVPTSVKSRADFDGDGRTDLSVFRPEGGNWYLNRSTAGFTAVNFGAVNDTLTPGDYDGDNKTDLAVKRDGSWFILNSSNSTFLGINWGNATDLPAAGDYDGDGKTDAAVFRPSDGTWYVLKSGGDGTLITQFGQAGDLPVPGDYDGDGKTDLGVYRSGNWYLLQSTSGFLGVSFGLETDNPVPADYDGDNKDDIAVFRPDGGNWYRLNSTNGQFAAVQFGQNGDVPVPGDYDGDGKDDQAVYRAGNWYLLQSTSGFAGAGFGLASDKPVPKAYIP